MDHRVLALSTSEPDESELNELRHNGVCISVLFTCPLYGVKCETNDSSFVNAIHKQFLEFFQLKSNLESPLKITVVIYKIPKRSLTDYELLKLLIQNPGKGVLENRFREFK